MSPAGIHQIAASTNGTASSETVDASDHLPRNDVQRMTHDQYAPPHPTPTAVLPDRNAEQHQRDEQAQHPDSDQSRSSSPVCGSREPG